MTNSKVAGNVTQHPNQLLRMTISYHLAGIVVIFPVLMYLYNKMTYWLLSMSHNRYNNHYAELEWTRAMSSWRPILKDDAAIHFSNTKAAQTYLLRQSVLFFFIIIVIKERKNSYLVNTTKQTLDRKKKRHKNAIASNSK